MGKRVERVGRQKRNRLTSIRQAQGDPPKVPRSGLAGWTVEGEGGAAHDELSGRLATVAMVATAQGRRRHKGVADDLVPTVGSPILQDCRRRWRGHYQPADLCCMRCSQVSTPAAQGRTKLCGSLPRSCSHRHSRANACGQRRLERRHTFTIERRRRCEGDVLHTRCPPLWSETGCFDVGAVRYRRAERITSVIKGVIFSLG